MDLEYCHSKIRAGRIDPREMLPNGQPNIVARNRRKTVFTQMFTQITQTIRVKRIGGLEFMDEASWVVREVARSHGQLIWEQCTRTRQTEIDRRRAAGQMPAGQDVDRLPCL